MPNKFARGVPIRDYEPRGLLPDGLLPVSRSDGSAEAELANASNRVATTFGAMADDAAKEEGKAAGKIAGLDPHYRPDGSLTLRGKAFNDAATQTYENNLDASMRTRMQAVFEANRGNPAALKKGFDDLQRQISQDDVFDHIRGDFNAQFSRLRLPYENKALGTLEETTKDENRASLVTNITATQTNAARMVAADPNSPATAKNIAIEMDRTDRLIDEQVAREDISAEAGAKLKQRTRNEIVQSAAVAQAGTLKSPEEIAAYRENVRVKFAKGDFKGLTGDGYATLDASLQALQNTRRTEINAGVAQLGKNLDDYIDRAASGLALPVDEWTRYQNSPAAKTPQGAQLMQVAETKVKIATVMSRLSIDDASRLVAGMRTEASKGGATAPDAAIIKFAEEQLSSQRKALNTDQLGFAAQKRLIPALAPLDFEGFQQSNDAAGLAAQFRDRTAQARAVGTELSRAPQFLRPDEKDRLQEIVSKGGAPALNLAGAIVKGAGSDAPSILREISNDAPLLAQAGNILANGGSQAAARDVFVAAKIKLETGKELPGLPTNDAAKLARDTYGTAFTMQGEDGGRIRATAEAITRARIANAGVDPKSSEAQAIHKRALQEAAGANFVNGVQYGGVADYKPGYWTSYKVPVPSNMRADAFRDVIRALRDDDLKALPSPPAPGFKASDIAGAVPIATRGGYRFALGDPTSNDPKYIRGADGGPFVLPFDALQTVAPRVSGAFLGGS